jgi:protein phosphatase PTC7
MDYLVKIKFNKKDNMFDGHILKLVMENKGMDSQSLAKVIVDEAEKMSKQKKYVSPFSKNSKEHGYNHTGGKTDDITVLVAKIEKLN